MYKLFYDQAKILDKNKLESNPTEDQINIILTLIREEKYARYFFYELNNPIWIPYIFNDGLFFTPPEPIEVSPGSFQIPLWPAGEYLARFANQYEDIVVDVLRSIKTTNWRAQEILIDAMLKIKPEKLSEIIPVIDEWVGDPFSGMLPNKLIKLTDHLYDNQLIDSAIRILDYVIKPMVSAGAKNFPDYSTVIRFRSDNYWANEYIEKEFEKLADTDPIRVTLAFEKQLKKAIDLTKSYHPEDAERYVGYLWRFDIPNRFSERKEDKALDSLIEGLRDGLIKVCKNNPKEGYELLNSYLNSEHIILRRLGMYVLRIFGNQYPDLINQTLLKFDYLERDEYVSEYQGLMRDHFEIVNEEIRRIVVSSILSKPIDEGEKKAQEFRKMYNLELVRNFLLEDELTVLNKLVDTYNKPDITEKPKISISSSWGGAPSPVSAEELKGKSFDQLSELFLTYIPEDLYFNPRESLGRTFQKIVRENCEKYVQFASYLINPQIRFIYSYHYLFGIREAIKENECKLTDDLLCLCEFVVNAKEDPFEESAGDHEPGLFALQMEVSNLLDSSLRSKDPYLTRAQLDRIRSLLIKLAYHQDPEPERESQTSFDPFTYSLNCVRGQTMHAIFQYSLYLVREEEKRIGEKLKTGFLEPEIEKILLEKLDFTQESSLAVHSVYGAFIPQLQYLSAEFLESNLSRIFPHGDEYNAYWNAAWDAYIFVSNVYKNPFNLLIPHYQRGLILLQSPKKEYFGSSPDERLAQHIMFAYLADLTDFGHENKLLDLFFQYAPDLIRAQGVFWLGQVLGDEKPPTDDILWEKCWQLWQNRLHYAETKDVAENTEEISSYMRWLANIPVGLDVLYSTLDLSVKYLHDGYDVRILNEFSASQCEEYSFEAVKLLQATIFSSKEAWWRPKESDEERILRVAMKSDDETKRIAIEIINYRGEHGDFRWKELLE